MNEKQLIDNIADGYEPELDEVKLILDSNEEIINHLFLAADRIRKQYCGDKIHIRGIIEFSNYCRCKCLYCGLNCKNKNIRKYRMTPDEIIENAKEAYKAGYKTLVLQSGEDLWYTREKISLIINEIKKLGDIAITLSIGEREYEDYKQWKKDGADRFLMKHETADENLYNYLHPHSNFLKRIQCLNWLNELGYQVGSGFMIGLPGQTNETIAKDILLLKKLNVDMAGIGPFISHEQTKLKNKPSGSTYDTLKAVAITRILLKNVHLPATTALGVLSKEDKKLVFETGANVIMLKVEPHKYRRLYEIYPKPQDKEKTILEERIELENFIKSINRKVAKERGDSLK